MGRKILYFIGIIQCTVRVLDTHYPVHLGGAPLPLPSNFSPGTVSFTPTCPMSTFWTTSLWLIPQPRHRRGSNTGPRARAGRHRRTPATAGKFETIPSHSAYNFSPDPALICCKNETPSGVQFPDGVAANPTSFHFHLLPKDKGLLLLVLVLAPTDYAIIFTGRAE
jgi:hypothetical protein